jgi:hypothetical protein
MLFSAAMFIMRAMLLHGGDGLLGGKFFLGAMLILGGGVLSDLVCHKSAQTLVNNLGGAKP